jgi:hypothetical protein
MSLLAAHPSAPINGMCWIWINDVDDDDDDDDFNTWRLNAMRVSSIFVVSEQCITRKKLLAARSYRGRTFVAFLKTLHDALKIPAIFLGAENRR